ncbi:hypothetical protein GCM10027341_15360 [Spirosoma knui]
MKTVQKSILLALVLLGAYGVLLSLTAQAVQARPTDELINKPTQITIVNTADPTVLQVLVEATSTGPLVLQLKNREGSTIWDYQIPQKQSTFRFRLNLTEVPDGQYQVVIRRGRTHKVYSLTLATTSIQTVRNAVIY